MRLETLTVVCAGLSFFVFISAIFVAAISLIDPDTYPRMNPADAVKLYGYHAFLVALIALPLSLLFCAFWWLLQRQNRSHQSAIRRSKQ